MIIKDIKAFARESMLDEDHWKSSQATKEITKQRITSQLRLISLFTLLNTTSEYPFKKLARQSDKIKIAITQLDCLKDHDFFIWYLK